MLEFGIFLHSLIIGFMIFFMSVVTPSVFSILNEDEAGKLLRVIFPECYLWFNHYYFIVCCFFVISMIDFLIISLVSAAFFLINLIYLTPRINIYRDKFKGGSLRLKKNLKCFIFLSSFIYLQLFGSIFIVFVYFY